MTQFINKHVTVTAMRFGKDFFAYPQRIEFDGVSYTFVDDARRSTSETEGEQTTLTLSDGLRRFRLRSGDDRGALWTLLSITV